MHPVAQRGSAAQRVLHHHCCVSIRGLTKPCASHPRGKTKSESWSINLTAFGFPAFGFPAFGGIWSFWLGKLSSSQVDFGETQSPVQTWGGSIFLSIAAFGCASCLASPGLRVSCSQVMHILPVVTAPPHVVFPHFVSNLLPVKHFLKECCYASDFSSSLHP